jgi:SAM-dependent methyltransferase
MSKLFNSYAAYYDLLYKDKDYVKEANFVKYLINKYETLNDLDILELGCGTGKHANLFAKMGYNIVGVDISPSMIDIANSNIFHELKDKLEFKIGDVRNINIKKQFDVVLSLFHVVSYQTTNIDLDKMFNTVSKHLKSGGLFIFDCWYGPGVLSDKPAVRIKRMENDEMKVLRISEPTFYPNSNLVDVDFTVQINDKNGKIDVISERHEMRYLFKPELEYFLERNDLNLVESVEWLSDKKIGFDSWIATFIAKKN